MKELSQSPRNSFPHNYLTLVISSEYSIPRTSTISATPAGTSQPKRGPEPFHLSSDLVPNLVNPLKPSPKHLKPKPSVPRPPQAQSDTSFSLPQQQNVNKFSMRGQDEGPDSDLSHPPPTSYTPTNAGKLQSPLPTQQADPRPLSARPHTSQKKTHPIQSYKKRTHFQALTAPHQLPSIQIHAVRPLNHFPGHVQDSVPSVQGQFSS